jgi:hypothetical protein
MALTIEEAIEDGIAALLASLVASDGEALSITKPLKRVDVFDIAGLRDIVEALGAGRSPMPIALIGHPVMTTTDARSQLLTETARVWVAVIVEGRGKRSERTRGATGTFNIARRIIAALRGQEIEMGALTTPPATMPIEVERILYEDHDDYSAAMVELTIRVPSDLESVQPY